MVWAQNISRGAVRLLVPYRPEIDEEVDLCLRLPNGKAFLVPAQVKKTEPENRGQFHAVTLEVSAENPVFADIKLAMDRAPIDSRR